MGPGGPALRGRRVLRPPDAGAGGQLALPAGQSVPAHPSAAAARDAGRRRPRHGPLPVAARLQALLGAAREHGHPGEGRTRRDQSSRTVAHAQQLLLLLRGNSRHFRTGEHKKKQYNLFGIDY